MDRKEKAWRIAGTILGGVGAALLVAILVLKLLKFDITWWTLPLVAVMVLFLIADDRARRLKRKRLAAEPKTEEPQPAPEPTLPKDAFEFESQEHER